jgi:preprotein translocase subunit SecY
MSELFQVIKDSSSGGISQSPLQIVFNLSMALILGLIYSYVYRLTYVGKKGDKILRQEMKGIQYTLTLLSIGGAFIWIVVADNLVRAFGLAGALSLIRFRTRVKDPSNTIKVFYAIIIGMSCGLSQYYAAIIGTVFMCFVLTIIYYIKMHEKKMKKLKQAEKGLLAENGEDEEI